MIGRRSAALLLFLTLSLGLCSAKTRALQQQDCPRACAPSVEPFFTAFKESYLTMGIPLNAKPDWDTNDLAFQLSFRMNILRDIASSGWNVFLAYSQLTLWDFFRPSNPIRSNIYNPGAYVSYKGLLMGYEHKSNGYDGERSRSVNYGFVSYTHDFGEHFCLQGRARFGVGSINNDFSLEMFTKYLGYCAVTVNVHTADRRLQAKASFAPLFGRGDIPGNVNAEISWRPTKNIEWFFLTIRYHFGYDENQCDCANPEVFLKHMLRFGVSIQPRSSSHNLF